uniref:hypothetical protein n=1 Tax=Altererythrobacter segetis TaxID=1104773 RepID=UPI001407F6CB|nr:hypothetical protein [Altererythrobacter segetis]
MKKIAIAATVLLLSAPAFAQATASAPINAAQQEHAVQNFAVLASAMQSDKVPEDVKASLMGCIYSNKLETISTAIDKLIEANPGKVDRAKPDDLLSAMVAVCGYKPSASAAAAKPPAGAPQGR